MVLVLAGEFTRLSLHGGQRRQFKPRMPRGVSQRHRDGFNSSKVSRSK